MVVQSDPNFWRVYTLTQVLECYWAQGRGETEEAERIRDQIDEVWWKLPANQKRWFNRGVELPKLPRTGALIWKDEE